MRSQWVKAFCAPFLGMVLPISSIPADMPQEKEQAALPIDCTDPRVLVSESSDVETGGIETEMGSFKEVFPAKTLPRKGSQIQFRVPVQDGTKGLILEIQEIHF